DIHGATSTVIESDPFYIDNLNPAQPGALTPTDDYSKNHITFSLGAQSSDSNFREYIIFWRDAPNAEHYSGWHTDYVDSNSTGYESILGNADYGGASTCRGALPYYGLVPEGG
ncbi:MAG: hypothetical protein R6T91_05995, partial [Bacteroidales bacterium]